MVVFVLTDDLNQLTSQIGLRADLSEYSSSAPQYMDMGIRITSLCCDILKAEKRAFVGRERDGKLGNN